MREGFRGCLKGLGFKVCWFGAYGLRVEGTRFFGMYGLGL